jgi:hypothetical protein
MRKILINLFIGIGLFVVIPFVNAQECKIYFPDNVGTVREMKTYDKKDKLTGVIRQEILDKKVSGNDVELKVRSSMYTPDNEETSSVELDLVCENGVFKFDMKNFVDQNTLEAYKDMQIEMSGTDLAYPSRIQPGEKLADGLFQMVVKNNNITLLTLTTNITDRQVEGTETITTEAGTFDCIKIKYNISVKAGFITTNMSAVEWITDGVGLVRSESFDRKGRPSGYSVLTSLR